MTRGVRRLVAVVAIAATASVGLTGCDDRSSSRDCRPRAAAVSTQRLSPIVVRPPVIRPPAPPKVYTPPKPAAPKPAQPQVPGKPLPQNPAGPSTVSPALPWYWWVPFIGGQNGRGC